MSPINVEEESLDERIDRRSFLKLSAAAALMSLFPEAAMAAISERARHLKARSPRFVSRSLYFYNLHTGENMDVAYFTRGRYSPAALKDINHLFRDYRTGTVKPIDPKLIDCLYAISLKLATHNTPFHIVSGYRTPATNAMLCKKSSRVARHSLHMKGKAVDIRLPNRNISAIRRAAVALKKGGVGYYPDDDFVHVDVGNVRYW